MRALETTMAIAMILLMVFASGLDSPDPAGARAGAWHHDRYAAIERSEREGTAGTERQIVNFSS